MYYLKIENFKCFTKANISLNGLTIMAGANGNGKSTAIQALLYLRRTIEHCGEWKDNTYHLNDINGLNVPLNGVYCLSLGNSNYILNQNYYTKLLQLGIFNEHTSTTVDYAVDESSPRLWLSPIRVVKEHDSDLPIYLQEFYYLNAERVGPRISQELRFFDYPNAGWQGETTAQILDLDKGYYKIVEERCFPNSKSVYIKDQVNFWLDFIIKGVKVKVETSDKTLSSQILLENRYTFSEPTFATNLGFGVSYILPILATGLIAKKGSFFIVENPEAHLHPSAQSKIGRFLAMVAKAGVNVIVETHSDHVINGIQIAAAKNEIDNNLITINYFRNAEEENQPNVLPIAITQKGELSEWPSGFFDQTQIDFAELIKLRKR
jgi:predicted ATPase